METRGEERRGQVGIVEIGCVRADVGGVAALRGVGVGAVMS